MKMHAASIIIILPCSASNPSCCPFAGDARQQAIPAHKIQHFGDNELHKLAEARGDSPVIYVPENRRFRAIDAFAHPGQLMQIHVGAKHAKVSGAALERVLQVRTWADPIL